MSNLYFYSFHALAKMLNLLFAFVITVGTHYAIEDSPWRKLQLAERCEEYYLMRKKTFIFKLLDDSLTFEISTENCPYTEFETFAIWTHSVVLVLGIVALGACFWVQLETVNQSRNWDLVFHIVSGIVLWVASLLMMSTEIIANQDPCTSGTPPKKSDLCLNFLKSSKKIIYAGLGLVSGAFYIMTGILVETKSLFGLARPTFRNEEEKDLRGHRHSAVGANARRSRARMSVAVTGGSPGPKLYNALPKSNNASDAETEDV